VNKHLTLVCIYVIIGVLMNGMSPREAQEIVMAAKDNFDRRVADKCVWHRWFAWKPVKADGKWRWLCTVGRKMKVKRAYPSIDSWSVQHSIVLHKYCLESELVFNALSDNDIIDERSRLPSVRPPAPAPAMVVAADSQVCNGTI